MLGSILLKNFFKLTTRKVYSSITNYIALGAQNRENIKYKERCPLEHRLRQQRIRNWKKYLIDKYQSIEICFDMLGVQNSENNKCKCKRFGIIRNRNSD